MYEVQLLLRPPLILCGGLAAQRAKIYRWVWLVRGLIICWAVVPFELLKAVWTFTPKESISIQWHLD
jgi:hypothetical protein